MALTLLFLSASASCVLLSDLPVSQKVMPREESRRPLVSAPSHQTGECLIPRANVHPLRAAPFPSMEDRMARAVAANIFPKPSSWPSLLVSCYCEKGKSKLGIKEASASKRVLRVHECRWLRAEPAHKLQRLHCLEMMARLKSSCNLFQLTPFFSSHIDVT